MLIQSEAKLLSQSTTLILTYLGMSWRGDKYRQYVNHWRRLEVSTLLERHGFRFKPFWKRWIEFLVIE